MKEETGAENTWCPGCGNFAILNALKMAVNDMVAEKIPRENFVIASGIGCHAKIVDYINLNTFYSIHGRVPPTLTGMKVANPKLKLIGFSGDGDGYSEGIAHLIHSAKRNTDITMIMHNNEVFALTTGQFTATSDKGYKGRSTPFGSIEEPINPLKLMLSSGATFVARGYAGKMDHLKNLIKAAVRHKGFALIDVLQPCVTYNNTFLEFNKKVYELKDHNKSDMNSAMKLSDEQEKIPIGIFYQIEKPTFEEQL
ncbi:MAG TPA: 2-oxoacid:ferredoxin oxidoreductase subunit beta [Candidatus Woesearchaeota archaeon]|nr:2-oxoacid:ferredoxin oxidoreductase subunit beta [Candidatus Woesearchaeota archaeon]